MPNSLALDCDLKYSVCLVKYNITYVVDTFYVKMDKFYHLSKERLGVRVSYINNTKLRDESYYAKDGVLEDKKYTKEKIISYILSR